jgi:membrane fusion protein, multidrug efflux system
VRKALIVLVLLAVIGGGAWYYRYGSANPAAASSTSGTTAPGTGGGGGGRGGRGSSILTVDTAVATRRDIVDYITVVGNLIGAVTVDVAPRAGGRIESVLVKMGDRVTKGQLVAKMEDRDVNEQVKQAEATLQVNTATASQRESDVAVAKQTLDRTQFSVDKGLTARMNLEDAQAKYNSAVSAVTVAKAQVSQTQARIDELKITLSNTNILSPVDGFVGRRNLDPGAFAGTNTVIISVVDISTVRLVANLVEKDFRRVRPGVVASIEVDAFPGEKFRGEVSRMAPVFDPATRTATMELEVPNPGFRLKPGMFARVLLMADRHPNALVLPRNAVVDVDSQRGVYTVEQGVARFKAVRTGLAEGDFIEVLDGIEDGTRVITVGALALKDGDRVTVVGQEGRRGGGSGKKGGD